MKTEPTSYSIDDLKKEKRTAWSGVRNYQARNNMRAMKRGDLVLIHHSSTGAPAVVGVGKIVKEFYPDPTQFDPKDSHFDPKASKEKPIWDLVDVQFVKKFKKELTLAELKKNIFFNTMPLTQQGSRLSVQPVSEKHFRRIEEMAEKD